MCQVKQTRPWDKFTLNDIHVISEAAAEELRKQKACEVLHSFDSDTHKLVPDGAGSWKVVPLKA
jgi:hypothetical protein